MSYQLKYFKYKKKYIQLKNQYGGMPSIAFTFNIINDPHFSILGKTINKGDGTTEIEYKELNEDGSFIIKKETVSNDSEKIGPVIDTKRKVTIPILPIGRNITDISSEDFVELDGLKGNNQLYNRTIGKYVSSYLEKDEESIGVKTKIVDPILFDQEYTFDDLFLTHAGNLIDQENHKSNIGKYVEINGLEGAQRYNNSIGLIKDYNSEKGRYKVEVFRSKPVEFVFGQTIKPVTKLLKSINLFSTHESESIVRPPFKYKFKGNSKFPITVKTINGNKVNLNLINKINTLDDKEIEVNNLNCFKTNAIIKRPQVIGQNIHFFNAMKIEDISKVVFEEINYYDIFSPKKLKKEIKDIMINKDKYDKIRELSLNFRLKFGYVILDQRYYNHISSVLTF